MFAWYNWANWRHWHKCHESNNCCNSTLSSSPSLFERHCSMLRFLIARPATLFGCKMQPLSYFAFPYLCIWIWRHSADCAARMYVRIQLFYLLVYFYSDNSPTPLYPGLCPIVYDSITVRRAAASQHFWSWPLNGYEFDTSSIPFHCPEQSSCTYVWKTNNECIQSIWIQ